VRFLHLCGAEPVEREMTPPAQRLGDLGAEALTFAFSFPGGLQATLEMSMRQIEETLFMARVRVVNRSSFEDAAHRTRDEALQVALVSTHTLLHLSDGAWISLQDPPRDLQVHADACRNQGTWPVLVGAPAQTEWLLSAPIILPDYPQIAPESPGDFFDATEIDEILTLRIQTLTDEEKQEMLRGDRHTRALLQRVESVDRTCQGQLHGAIRARQPIRVRPGDRVRLRPRRRADAFDLLLDGKVATVVAVEQDYSNRTHVAVTLDYDPGNDLGADGKPGHRFFFDSDEVERLGMVRILIAGIGNIFLGDDAFGVHVAQRLGARPWPDGVRVIDFGSRGMDLAYALQDGYDAVILIDAYAHGGVPGDLCVIEPRLDAQTEPTALAPDAHGMDPLTVMRWVQSTGGRLPLLRLVGCEPATFGPEEGQMELSAPVEAAIEPAVEMVASLVAGLMQCTN